MIDEISIMPMPSMKYRAELGRSGEMMLDSLLKRSDYGDLYENGKRFLFTVDLEPIRKDWVPFPVQVVWLIRPDERGCSTLR
jgi:hypothetical protein